MKVNFNIAKKACLALALTITFGWILSSCGGSSPADPDNNTKFIQSVRLFTLKKETLTETLSGVESFASLLGLIQYDMTFYRVIYKTQYRGVDIQVSGLVSVPEGVENAPIVSAHHGTRFANNQAPSNIVVNLFDGGQPTVELFGATGYITFAADYIGYGESNTVIHPYYDKDLTASAIIDFITAGKEFLVEEGISFSDDLFLFGYSEGGFATMATLEKLQNDNDPLLSNIRAVAAGAGGFYIQGIMDDVLNRTEHPEPGFLGFVVRSYNETYEWGRPYTDFFQEPYASRISGGLLDGGNNKDQVNAQLTTVIDDFVATDFKTNLLAGTETQMLDSMASNSVHNFAPQKETRVYHCPNDEVLTIENSRFTVQTMQGLGASNITFHEVDGNSHTEGAAYTVGEAITWFNTF